MAREQVFFGPLTEREEFIRTIKVFMRESKIEIINLANHRNLQPVSADLTQDWTVVNIYFLSPYFCSLSRLKCKNHKSLYEMFYQKILSAHFRLRLRSGARLGRTRGLNRLKQLLSVAGPP